MGLKLDEVVVEGLPVIGMAGNLDAHTSAALDTVVMKHLKLKKSELDFTDSAR